MKRCVFSHFFAWAGALATLTSGCASSSQECPVLADQKSSFMAMAEDFPLNVVADSAWSIEEREALRRAVLRWNDPARSKMAEDAFRLGFERVRTLSSQKTLQGCDLEEGDSGEFLVHRAESISQWLQFGFSETTPAVTLRCHRGDQLSKQAILVNPALVHSDQMMSVFLHELGHAIGLDHSCQLDRGSSSYRACAGLRDDHPYVLAVMFPTLKVKLPSSRPIFSAPIFSAAGGPDIKETLGSNDLLRAGCVFDR